MKIGKILAAAALLANGAAHAATLKDAQGDVRVSRGVGFVLVSGSADLSPGDKIKVGRNGTAKLVYPDGCSVNVAAGVLATVAKLSPCSFRAQAGGNNSDGALCNPLDDGCGNNNLLYGGLALGAFGGGIGTAVGLTGNSSSSVYSGVTGASN